MAPSFFKILLNPSSPHLRLPTDYRKKHLKNEIIIGPIIISVSGGYTWRLKIKRIGNDYYFTDGWKNVVEDIPLGLADFLIFRPVDQSTFNMLIYNPNGCQKLLPPKADHHVTILNEDDETDCNDDDDDDDYHDDDDDVENEGDDPVFKSIMTKIHLKALRFPVKFAESAGIKSEGSMRVKNVDGREWVTCLRLEKSYGTNRFYLTIGWGDFRRENDISKGDECLFKFIRSEGKLLLAKVTKN